VDDRDRQAVGASRRRLSYAFQRARAYQLISHYGYWVVMLFVGVGKHRIPFPGETMRWLAPHLRRNDA